uniref:NADH dehydrogenase subunit 6 n=1 Tax=Cardiochiles fuscipennis TaxID=69312 RepID=A0A0A6ZLR4_9HYME|nr:NADH dehydrogenase subunit 6 [Cardiochiles fuscipennis]
MLYNQYFIYFLLDFMLIFIMILPSNLFKFHPFNLCLFLIIYVILVCIKMNYLIANFWYSYILFLIMIGGVMVLFMYFTSISSNEEFFFNYKYILYWLLKMFFFFIVCLCSMFYIFKFSLSVDNYEILSFINSLSEQKFSLKNLYMNVTMDKNFFMMIYLFLTMTCSILICTIFKIPMRQMN